jgi:hypothetical protein
MMSLADWLVVLDAIAPMRLRHCMLCHGPLDDLRVEAWHDGVVTATVALCAGCQTQDATREAVHALMHARYVAERYSRRRYDERHCLWCRTGSA